eukprot:519784-Amorphochlora_amoeboformis.AAC.1
MASASADGRNPPRSYTPLETRGRENRVKPFRPSVTYLMVVFVMVVGCAMSSGKPGDGDERS